MLAELALYIKLTGPSVALSNGDATFAFAVWRAARWLEAFDLPMCAAVLADHLPCGARNPYTDEDIAAVEGSCFVQMWLLSRSKTATSVGAFEAGVRQGDSPDNQLNGDISDLSAESMLHIGESDGYWPPNLEFKFFAHGDR